MAVASSESIVDLPVTKEQILADYSLAVESREISLAGRKEVFMGKAKFGIFGDGKEVPQLALARAFQKGDWRSGYYRDQTLMMAIGQHSSQEFFAQLYAHTDVNAEPASGGRMMNGHFASRWIDDEGNWLSQTEQKNSSADISCTGGQMPRLVGLAYASKLYRNNPDLAAFKDFSINGNEVAFGTIGNASTSEGLFFEAINAMGVLQVPVVMSVWDDGYGISVPQGYHTTKQSISKFLAGLQRNKKEEGYEIFVAKGWDYPELVKTYQEASKIAREKHIPCLVHVTELTQPQGHSTSGSHERYKSKERLDWEKEHDCILKMKECIISEGIASEKKLEEIEKEAKQRAKVARTTAWKDFVDSIKVDAKQAVSALETSDNNEIRALAEHLNAEATPEKHHVMSALKKALRISHESEIENCLRDLNQKYQVQYSDGLLDESQFSALSVPEIKAEYSDLSPLVDGREVLQACFDNLLANDSRFFAIGEDVGRIGDVNQGFAGLQEKYGDLRVTDTGIREATIVGQGIGAAMRGLRPLIEIQYLDYLLYGLQTLSDDLATLHYRTFGGQKAPLIIRTRGHRLEGVWHSGSPMGMILNSLRGIHVISPRNMTQAAGFYNTLMKSDDPALVIESLNGYRLKERIPDNLSDFTVPLGVPEILREGSDVTLVTYGSMCRIALSSAEELDKLGISVEVIDVQTLMPFDIHGVIVESLKKTNRLVLTDEDVSGGATGFMLQQILEKQKGYFELDSNPVTITGKDHRPAYGSDGDYFSKPNDEDLVDSILKMMRESLPHRF